MTVCIIGSGNVAKAMVNAFVKNGITISAIVARNSKTGNTLAVKAKAHFFSYPIEVLPKADLYLLCVSDQAIDTIAKTLPNTHKIVAHTAGSVALNVLSQKFKNAGVFYPLQTLKFASTSLKKVPLCIEASNTSTEQKLMLLASKISNHTLMLNSENRLHLHLAAVVANNFTNHLYTQAYAYLQQYQIDFKLLLPLIDKTTKMIHEHLPKQLQTGPAVRNDTVTLKKHLALLDDNDSLKALYKTLTQSIQKMNS